MAWLWTSLLVVLSVISKSSARKLSFIDFFGVDKVAHFGFYAVLVFLWSIVFSHCHMQKPMLKSFVMAVVLGALLEYIQKYCTDGRSFEYDDMIANTLGALLGVMAFKYLAPKLKDTSRSIHRL